MSTKWKAMPSMSTKRDGVGYTVIDDNRFVVLEGDLDADISSGEMYDRRTKKWTKLPNDMACGCRYDCATASIDNKVYVVGGTNGFRNANSLFALDTETLEWKTLPSMKEKRGGCAAVAVGRFIYVFGGYGKNTAERYNVDTQQWEDLPSMSTIRWSCAAVAVQNKIYGIGGTDGDNNLVSVEVFDVDTQKWESPPSVKNMSVARYWCAAVVLGGRFVVVMGGEDGSNRLSSIEVLDESNYLSSVEVLDTATGYWTTSPYSMITPRSGHGAVVLGDSNIYVAGGHDGSNNLKSCESIPSAFFLPASNTVEDIDDSVSASVDHVLTAPSARKRKRKAQEDYISKESVALTTLAMSSLHSSITNVQQQQTNIRNERFKWLMAKTENPGLTAICDQQLAKIEETEIRLTKKEESLEKQLANFIKEQQEH